MGKHGRDVVITGMGAVTPLGIGVARLREGLQAGRSGVDWSRLLPDLDPDAYPVRYAAEVQDFNVDEHLQRHCEVRTERSVQMGLVAAREALEQASLLDASDCLIDPTLRIETLVGSGHGACHEAEVGYSTFFQRGLKPLRPTTIPKSMFNSLSSNLSIYFAIKGTNLVVASACASGASAIGLAMVLMRHGYADVVLAGGADSPLTPVNFACWTKLRVLAHHDDPRRAARPFDRNRNGMVLGEGAAMLILEAREHAEHRDAFPLASLRGYGASSDAHHVTAPTVDGQRRAMARCLEDADLPPEAVDYVNAHGTGTKVNDESEAQAIVGVFGSREAALPVSSIKSMLGHSLGAAGAIELVACVEAVRHGFLPPTVNCDDPDPDCGLDYLPHEARRRELHCAMSNSFAFGGNNVSLLVEREA